MVQVKVQLFVVILCAHWFDRICVDYKANCLICILT